VRKSQHRHVSIGVATSDKWEAADPAPDAYRFLRSVVEELDLRLVHQIGAVVVYPEVEPERAADHPFRRNLVKLLRERAHKITVPPEAIQVANPLARNNSIIGT